MPTACVNRPQATETSSVLPIAQPPPSENFGELIRSLFNKIAAVAALRDNTTMAVATRTDTREQPPQPDACIDATI